MKIFVLIALIAFAACGTQNKLTETDLSAIYGNKWLLRKIHTDGTSQEVSTKAFIKFDKEKGSAGGNGSCNSFGSNFTFDKDSVKFSNIFSTKMYCEEVQQIENSYFQQLAKVNRLAVKDRTLLMYKDKELLLEFQAE
jgi:heat shock protein HslJ